MRCKDSHQKMIFSVGFAENITTRVFTNNSFKSTFEAGDAIGIFAYRRNVGDASSIERNELMGPSVGRYVIYELFEPEAYPILKTNVAVLNEYLLQIEGGEAIDLNGSYLTSTETTAFVVHPNEGAKEAEKTTYNKIRAYYEF